MSTRAASHPLWVFIPKGTPVSMSDRTAFEHSTTEDCTCVVYRHKRAGRWAHYAFTDHDGVPGHPHRVYVEWRKCTKLKDGGTLQTDRAALALAKSTL